MVLHEISCFNARISALSYQSALLMMQIILAPSPSPILLVTIVRDVAKTFLRPDASMSSSAPGIFTQEAGYGAANLQ